MAVEKAKRSAPPAMKRILLVDDHPMVRERLTEVIHREADLTVCGEAEDRFEALEKMAASQPDLAIVDLTLKRSNGMELIKDIRVQFPAVPILVLSMHDELLYAERVIRAGVRGYITKQEATRKVMQAIRSVLAGDIYLSEKMAAQIAAAAVGAARAKPGLPLDGLSDRELSVFEMIGRGRSTRQIADELKLEMRTIETYRARIKDKLNLKDANELLQYAIRWAQSEGAG
jgi:DNA-binding NarL/FixJ family response regulator